MNCTVSHEMTIKNTFYGLGEKYPCIRLPKVYQTYHGYMSLSVKMYHEPIHYMEAGYSGPGYPPEYFDSIQVGSINASANPAVEWHDYLNGFLRIREFIAHNTPREDLGKGVIEKNKITLEQYITEEERQGLINKWRGKESDPITQKEIYEAASIIENASVESFAPLYQKAVMKIREKEHQNRIKAKQNLLDCIQKLEERIKLGTNMAEPWEDEHFMNFK